jgi:hypothetical protein
LNTYLRIFYSTFPLRKVHHESCNKAWLTSAIRISCANKIKLLLIQISRNDPKLTIYYKRYCRILTNVIKLAKKTTIKSILTCSNDKTKTTWNIVKNTLNMKPNTHNITSVNVNGTVSSNSNFIAEMFNKYFVTVAQIYM